MLDFSKGFQRLDVEQERFVKIIHLLRIGVCHSGELKNVVYVGVDNFAAFAILFFDYVFHFFITLYG